MEQLKQSEEEIIKLGKTLVKELELENSTNTLARWMAHYLAELLHNLEHSKSQKDRISLQKECFEIILKLWSQKEYLPIRQPLEDLKPIIKILEKIKPEEKTIRLGPAWLEYKSIPDKNEWANFVSLVKNNSEKLFYGVFEINLHKDLLKKDVEWMEQNKEFLTSEQISFLESIDYLTDYKNLSFIDFNNYSLSSDNHKRIKAHFEYLETLLKEQQKELSKIKKSYIKDK